MNFNLRSLRQVALPAFAAAALLSSIGIADGKPRFVLRVADHDGSTLFEGTSSEPGHEDWLDVLAFGTATQTTTSEDGTASIPCTQGDFTFHKRIDRTTPLFQQACLNGLLLPAVQIKYLGNEGDPATGFEPLTIELRHVQVFGYRMNGLFQEAGDPLPTEEVTLGYTEVEWTYLRTTSNGALERSNTSLATFLATEDPAFDDDKDGLTNDLDDDDDNDGIADTKEVEEGTNPFLNDADGDLDGDRQSNGDEAIAGTRMDDASDFFGIESIRSRRTPEGLQMTVSFPVKEGRRIRGLCEGPPEGNSKASRCHRSAGYRRVRWQEASSGALLW